MRHLLVAAFSLSVLAACQEKKVTPAPTEVAPTATSEGALRLGAPIEANVKSVALADVAKDPASFAGKKVVTTGTVSAVCQHMGCWMEIKDDASEAHIKMAGHAFFVPKTASGRKARVLGTFVKDESEAACADADDKMAAAVAAPNDHAGHESKGKEPGKKTGCRAEAETQMGRPLAKLELVAEGVELM